MNIEKVQQLPSFQTLVQRRARMTWGLSIFIIVLFLGNLYLMSWGTELGAVALDETGTITVALVYSVILIVAGAGTAAFYVWWANRQLDHLVSDVCAEVDGAEGGEAS